MVQEGHMGVPTEHLFLWRARLSFVVWVAPFLQVIFLLRLSETMPVKRI